MWCTSCITEKSNVLGREGSGLVTGRTWGENCPPWTDTSVYGCVPVLLGKTLTLSSGPEMEYEEDSEVLVAGPPVTPLKLLKERPATPSLNHSLPLSVPLGVGTELWDKDETP